MDLLHLIAMIGLLFSVVRAGPNVSCAQGVAVLKNYECIGDKIFGEGSYSVTYVVKKKGTDEKFIMKIHASTWSTHRSTDESQILKEFKGSKHVIQLYDQVTEGQYLYEIMEFGVRGDLKHFLNVSPEYFDSFEKVLEFSKKLVDGLIEIHEHGYVHGDVKTQNVVVTKDYDPKYIDFNLTVPINKKVIGRGDPFFMPPEILPDRDRYFIFNPDKDVYPLGLILYDIYYKQLPFNSWTLSLYKRQVARKEYVFYSGIPVVFMDVIRGCLRENPEDRLDLAVIKQMLDSIDLAKPEKLKESMVASLTGEIRPKPFIFVDPLLAGIFVASSVGVLLLITTVAYCVLKRKGMNGGVNSELVGVQQPVDYNN